MPRSIETIGWLVFYAAFTIFALTARGASPIYNAVFIDRNVADWLPDASRGYVPPDSILGQRLSPYFARSWWPPESDRRWGKGARSTIIVQPTGSLAAGSRVRGRIGALLGGSRTQQTITIEVNGSEVARLDFRDGEGIKTFDVPLPAPYAADDQIEIAFMAPGATSMLLLHAGDDSRQRGVCFFDLALVPAP